jgi:hypothetical protein
MTRWNEKGLEAWHIHKAPRYHIPHMPGIEPTSDDFQARKRFALGIIAKITGEEDLEQDRCDHCGELPWDCYCPEISREDREGPAPGGWNS